MQTRLAAVTALGGSVLFAPLMLGHAQAGIASHGNLRNWHGHYRRNTSVCSGYPVFDFWYG